MSAWDIPDLTNSARATSADFPLIRASVWARKLADRIYKTTTEVRIYKTAIKGVH